MLTGKGNNTGDMRYSGKYAWSAPLSTWSSYTHTHILSATLLNTSHMWIFSL